MQGSVGLEVMNSTNPDVNWKAVTKGRRSKKPTARSFNGISKAGNSISPNRVGDFSGSDSDKVNEAACGQSTSGKSESVPIKKRRHLLHNSPSRKESTSQGTSRPLSEDHEQILFSSCSSGKVMSTWQTRDIDSEKAGFGEGFDHVLFCEQAKRQYNEVEDFSGIELLAAAASMDEELHNVKEDLVAGDDPLLSKIPDTLSSAEQSELPVSSNKSENSSSNMFVNEGSVACSDPAAVPDSSWQNSVDGAVPKVNRQHWDLNTLMDAWDDPYDDSLARNTSKEVDDGMHMEDGHKVLIDPVNAGAVATDLKMQEHNAPTVFTDGTCIELSNLVKYFPDPSNVSGKDAVTSNPHEGADGRISPDQILSSDAHKDALNQVLKTNASVFSDGVMLKETLSSSPSSTATVIKYEDCSSNLINTESATFSESIQAGTRDVNVDDMPATGVSETALDVDSKDIRGPQECVSPGTCVQDVQPLTTDPKIGIDGTHVLDSTNAERQGLQFVELVAKHEDASFPNAGLQGITIEDSCKSSSAAPQCDGPSSSVGKIESTADTQQDSDVSQDNHFDGIAGIELARRFEEGYDSPYEDGELRASYSYSWEDNELGNECVDYESDGRNEDGPNGTEYRVVEIVENVSQGSRGTQRQTSCMKRLPIGSESKTCPVRHSLRRYFAKDESNNEERAGKGSNAGSGTTVEQSMDMDVDENDDIMKRRQLTDRRENVDIKMAQMDEYMLKTGRGKLQSRIEGRSSWDVNYGKEVFYAQPCRPRRLTFSYSRPEREMSPEKHVVRYRPATHVEREGDRNGASWGSRRRYTSNYQASEGRMYTRPRSINGDLDKIGGMDAHDPRQTANYFAKGPHRPMMRSTSERDDYYGVRKRMPLSRGVSSYRSRGRYSQRGGREFREDLESLPDDTGGAPVCFSRYISRRDRSFSPGSGRTPHMPLPRRKSRSRSRSRTRSPGPWRPNRERVLSIRRHSRSPDFRPEPRMERMRMPFQKPTFAPDYGEDYISPSRGRFSPQRNHPRWVEDQPFPDNHVRRRRSPGRLFKRTQRFDSVGSSGRPKSDEYFRPMLRPGRFSFKPNGIYRDYKLDNSYDDRRGGDGSDTMHHYRGQLHPDDGANIRRFRHNAAAAAADDEEDNDGNFENSNMNKKDDPPQVAEVPPQLTQVDGEDKRSFKI